MKKVLLATMILTTPALAGGIDSTINPLASVIGGYSSETANNGDYETSNTKDTSVQGTVGKIAGGTVTVGLTKRKETLYRVLESAKFTGHSTGEALSVGFSKTEPKWGFWGGRYAYGEAKYTIHAVWNNDVALLGGETQTGKTTSKSTEIEAFVGTNIKKLGWDITPMAKYTYFKEALKDTDLTNGIIRANSKFSLLAGTNKFLELSITGRRKVGDGVIALSATFVDTKGTKLMSKIKDSVVDYSPTKRIGHAYAIGYTLPLNDNLIGDVFYQEYKNSETVFKTTYVGLTYKF